MLEHTRFAIKVAISMSLVYLIPFSMGWAQASTSAITVMLIASTGSRRESLSKGVLRALGTLVGAVIGLLLVGMFSQERILYMLCVSIVVSFIFYFRTAYRSDPSLLALTGVMVLMISNGGDAEGALLYAIERTYMTIFGVTIYTLVGTFLWPVKTEQNLRQLIEQLNRAQQALFVEIFQNLEGMNTRLRELGTQVSEEGANPTINKLLDKVLTAQGALEQRFATVSAECSDVSAYMKEWQLTVHFNKQLTQELYVLAHSHFNPQQGQIFINNFDQAIEEIHTLFKTCREMWDNKGPAYRAQEFKVEYNQQALSDASHIAKGFALTQGHLLKLMHQSLSRLVECTSCIDSVSNNISFKQELPKPKSKFLWWDAENFKTAVKTFTTYWVAGLIWIYFNPPGGYSFVTFSTIFIPLLSFVPVHPFKLLVLFTFGFLFAVPSYVFILPGLELGVELGLFIFIYTFVGFYLLKGPVTIFYMIGLFALGLDNTMTYHFGILMAIMTLFYMVVFMLIFSHYFPFKSRPEHLYVTVTERYFRHLKGLFSCYHEQSESAYKRMKSSVHLMTLNESSRKLKVWGSKIDLKLFNGTRPEAINVFGKSCDTLCNHVNILMTAEQRLLSNPLIKQLRSKNNEPVLPLMASSFATRHATNELDFVFEIFNQDNQSTEDKLDVFFSGLDISSYTHAEIVDLYIFLNLKRNVFRAINQCKQTYEDIDWVNLRQKRF